MHDNKLAIEMVIRDLWENRGESFALCEAVRWSRMELIKEMISAGVNPNARKPSGVTPMMLCNKKKVGELLVKHGADLNAQDERGRTPLIWFLFGLHRQNQAQAYLKWLMTAGADPYLQSKAGEDPVELARNRYQIDLLTITP